MWIVDLVGGSHAAVSHDRAPTRRTPSLFARLRSALERRRTRLALGALSDHELRDIGLHRGVIDAAARGVMYPESAARPQRRSRPASGLVRTFPARERGEGAPEDADGRRYRSAA